MAAPRVKYFVFWFFFVLKALSNYIRKELSLTLINKLVSKEATGNII